ncbi:hypothetical protein C8A01DRAFT_49666 [Parachaetomium inaequale]|uniref:Protein SSH4 n=1 Tax=Parachaetomium inaequale TaxID=2588326 RepID=A0AAN6SNJ9_9PEZI|nr:hypothetical protein C8A01DRAFT_49666 [Parachaetomium inaequale]
MAPRSIDFLWKEARTQFLDQLPTRQRQHEEALLDDTTLEDTLQTLSAAKDKAEKAYGTKFKGKPVEIKLSRALNRLEFILRFGDAAMKFAPETVSCVWAAFRLVASGVSQDFDSCQFLVDAVDQMSDILLVCEVYAKRQLFQLPDLSGESCLMADKVLEKIPPLLALVLRFAYETRRLVIDKGRFKRVFTVMFGGAQELKDIFKDAEAKRDELDRAAGIAVHEAVIQLLQATNQDTETIIKYLDGLELTKEELLKSPEMCRKIRLEQLREKQVKEMQGLDNELREQLNWLQRDGLTAPHEPSKVMREHLAQRYPGTCEWVITDRRFLSWLEPRRANSPKGLLWLAGEAGFGKSILMSYIMSHLEQQEPSSVSEGRPVVLRFFCKLGNDSSQKGARVVAHLLCQLLHLAELEGSLEVKKRSSNEAEVNPGRISLLLELAQAFKRRVYLLIDGLDECEDRSDGLLASLVRIAGATLDVRLLVSSRPLHDIHQAFARHSPPKIDLEQGSTAKDVEGYIAGSLRTISRFDQPKRRKAPAQIARKAAGMFRYANLAVEGLKSPAALRKSFKPLMDQLPAGLTELYEQELRALEPAKREILMVALRWVVCGKAPISLDLIADELEGKYLNECSDSETEEDDMEDDNQEIEDFDISRGPSGGLALITRDEQERDCIRHLKSAGRNFLRIDNSGIVTVQHTSVRDFIFLKSETAVNNRAEALCASCQERFEPFSTAEAGLKQGHLTMALRCLALLNCSGFQSEFLPLSVLEQHRIALLARGDTESNADSVMPCCEPALAKEQAQTGKEQSQVDDISDRSYISFTDPRPSPLRYELTHWHYHVRAAESLWKKDERDTEEWLDLYEQIGRFLNDTQVSHTWQLIVSQREDEGHEWPTRNLTEFDLPIRIASQYGILHYLHGYLESGGAIDILNKDGCTPLHLACSDKRGHAAVRLLVEHGADVNKRCHCDKTPLTSLVEETGPLALVQCLLDHGANATRAALSRAIKAGNFELVKTLSAHGGIALIKTAKDALDFVFHHTENSDEIIAFLLAKGADANGGDPHMCSPLYQATIMGKTKVAKMLLEAGAEIDKGNYSVGRTALQEAVAMGNLDMVNLLLEHGTSVAAKDKGSRNAIWDAVLGVPNSPILTALLDVIHGNPNAKSALHEPDKEGRTLLHWCARSGRVKELELLLDAGYSRAMVSHADLEGNTPLHLAANRGNAETASLLIEHGADVLSTNSAGHSALGVSVQGWNTCRLGNAAKFIRTVDLLLDQHILIPRSLAPKLLQLAQLTDEHGWTPLMVALHNRNPETTRILLAFDGTTESNTPNGSAGFEHGHRPSGWRLVEEELESMDNFRRFGMSRFGSLLSPRLLADHPVPFVIEAVETEIGLGLAGEWCFPNFVNISCFDGTARRSTGLFDRSYGQGDTIGCGIDFVKGVIFFTKNGVLLGDAFEEVTHCRLFPAVRIDGGKVQLKANFGTDPNEPFCMTRTDTGQRHRAQPGFWRRNILLLVKDTF